ncbi:MAG: prepilin-type N-terminal cleavage/methylation domain-containing protein [Rickettsiales bacterium]
MHYRFPSNTGFSLIELSIVLTIIGLITGGILGGMSLVRAAELRSVPAEYEKYQTATQLFWDKYRVRPGDMDTAISYWGTTLLFVRMEMVRITA